MSSAVDTVLGYIHRFLAIFWAVSTLTAQYVRSFAERALEVIQSELAVVSALYTFILLGCLIIFARIIMNRVDEEVDIEEGMLSNGRDLRGLRCVLPVLMPGVDFSHEGLRMSGVVVRRDDGICEILVPVMSRPKDIHEKVERSIMTEC